MEGGYVTDPEIPIQPPEFYPRQRAFVHSPAHFTAFVAGIGSGKTTAGAARSLLASYGHIGDETRLQIPNLGMITAPTYTMLKDASLRTFMDVVGTALAHFNRGEMLARLTNGSEILFRSAHAPDRLRGPSLSWWWGDEAALYDPAVWNIMIGRLRQFGQLGYAWVSSTPRGKNWLWQVFVRDNQSNPDYALFQAKTADNRFLDDAIVQAWTQSYTGDFARQELDGEFVAYEGLIYAEFDRALHVTTRRPEQFSRILAGVDWGLTNPGVILVGGLDYDGRLFVLYEEYARNRPIDAWTQTAVQLRDLWEIEAFYCDPSGSDYIADFERAGLRAVKASNTVNTGIQRVKARLTRQTDGLPRLFIHPSLVHTIEEFENYRWATGRYGPMDKPLKVNDHTLDALRYLVMGVDTADSEETLMLNVGQWA